MKKISFIFHKLSYGGACKSVVFFANTLSEYGYEVEIITYRKNAVPKHVVNSKVKMKNVYGGTNKFLELILLTKYLYQNKPDLLVGFMSINAFYSVILGKMFNINSIVSERGCPYHETGWGSKLKKYVMNFANGAIFQSNGARDYYSEFLKKKSAIIKNPAPKIDNLTPFLTRNEKFMMVGRIDNNQKRYDVAVDSAFILKQKKININIDIFGDGKDFSWLSNYVGEKGLNGSIRLHGAEKNAVQKMQDYEFLIFTSDFEGMPNVILEAMASGCICIASKCSPGINEELIEHGFNGFLFDTGDAKQLSEIIEKVVSGEFNCNEISKNAAEIKEVYNEGDIKNQIIGYFNERVNEAHSAN